jgi:hypothetical protein
MKLRAKILLPTTLVAALFASSALAAQFEPRIARWILCTVAALLAVMATTWALARSRLKQAIRAAGQDFTDILRTNNQAAFQANIRPRKTAEATRPGDASDGFAAIVDDVRLLSQRCAATAAETAREIDACASSSEQGVEIGAYVAKSFAAIQERILELESVVAKVAAPAQGRRDGTWQVNTVVTQSDPATRSDAGSAEESAIAADKLCALAVLLNNLVASLQQLAGGARRGPGVSAGATATPGHAPRKPPESMHRLSRPVRPESADSHTLSTRRREVPGHRLGRGIKGQEKFSRS